MASLALIAATAALAPSPYAALDAIKGRAFAAIDAAGGQPPATAAQAYPKVNVEEAAQAVRELMAGKLTPYAALDAIQARAFSAFDAELAKPLTVPSSARAVQTMDRVCEPVGVQKAGAVSKATIEKMKAMRKARAVAVARSDGCAIVGAFLGAAALVGYQYFADPALVSSLVGTFTSSWHGVEHPAALTQAVDKTAPLSITPWLTAMAARHEAMVQIAAAHSALLVGSTSLLAAAAHAAGLTRGMVSIKRKPFKLAPGQNVRSTLLEANVIGGQERPIGSCGLEVLKIAPDGLMQDYGAGVRHRAVLSGTLFVEQYYRRRGVAQRLLLEAEGVARSWGMGEMLLLVQVRNTAALRLYEKLGYTQMARTRNHGSQVCLKKQLFAPSVHTLRSVLPQLTTVELAAP